MAIEIKLEPFTKSDYAKLLSWIEDEEMLMQFGGPNYTFPLTPEQLDKSLEDKNRLAFKVVDTGTGETIGHCEIYVMEESAKLSRILIGDKQQRGKGLGQQIVQVLIEYVFKNLNSNTIELNVFEWNTAAIKCYEKAGFRINPSRKLERKIKGQTWIAVNMVLDNEEWKRKHQVLQN